MVTVTAGAAGAGGSYDYTCDGTADQVEIAAAIADCGAGDTVSLSAGTFECAAGFDVPIGVSLTGTPTTILNFAAGAARYIYLRGTNAVQDLDLRGPIVFSAEGSDVACARLTSRQAGYGAAAFRVRSRAGATVENVTFDDCHAIDCWGQGFLIEGDAGYSAQVNDITVTACSAIRCGADPALPEAIARWICGFLVEAAGVTYSRVIFSDCVAEGNYYNGFHVDIGAGWYDCEMVRCTSTENGLSRTYPTGVDETIYPETGFFVKTGWTLTDCVSAENRTGFSVYWGSNDWAEPVDLIRCAAVSPAEDAFRIYERRATLTDCTADGVAAPDHTVYFYGPAVYGARATGFQVLGGAGTVAEANGAHDNVVTYLYPAFTASIAAPVTGEAVAFADALTFGDTGWAWDFGDGDGSTARDPAHAYPSAGVYPVVMTVGGRSVSQTVTVVNGVSYGGARLSEADLGPIDHDPVANATGLQNGRVGLQGSPVSRRTWTIDALADDHAEIDALDALMGQRLTLNLNGVEYPGVMIRPPMLETQLTPAAWAYQIGLVQETRHA